MQKNYIQWDYIEGKPIGVPSNAKGDKGDWLECFMPPPRTSVSQTLKWTILEGTHENYLHGSWEGSPDPLDQIATHELIKDRRTELETAPIIVFGELFDCDAASETRMRDALDTWDYRPLLGGVFEEREINGETVRVILWTKGDNNQAVLVRAELQAVFDEMLRQRALRGAILFARHREFKANPETTIRQIMDDSNWL